MTNLQLRERIAWRSRMSGVAGVVLGLLFFAGSFSSTQAAVDRGAQPGESVPAGVPGGDPDSCRIVRLSDIGWTDVTATTAILSRLLSRLGYEPRTTLLSVPVTYEAMKNGAIDVFLGSWVPAQGHDRARYLQEGSVEVVRRNLNGAKYTLAVPAYLYAEGLRSFADIQRFAPALHASIYGIESGNNGNRNVLAMIAQDQFGLGRFHLVESSEQGMLAEVARSYAERAPIVFLAWDPHPMNMQFDIRYLSGGDAVFGPNYGGAAVDTLVRGGYLQQCPNVARLLRNLSFTTRGESEVMRAILTDHVSPDAAAESWLRMNSGVATEWLRGVESFRAGAGGVSVGTREGLFTTRFLGWLTAHKLPVGESLASLVDWVKQHGKGAFGLAGAVAGGMVAGVYALLRAIPAFVLVIGSGCAAWRLHRSVALGVFVALGLLFIMNLGYWQQTLETLALVLVATAVATLIGVPVGIACAHRPSLAAALRPVLDLMQTLPTFVYLIPTLVLFGLGVVPALISTIIFALPAPIRLTQLGISGVARSLTEAGEAFGATRLQMLLKVELPAAAPLIFAGITQCIMLSLSMVVIAALVGAGGLGVPVVRALNSVQIGMGVEAGLAIVLLAIILERITRTRPQR